jgi:hypothetical protein
MIAAGVIIDGCRDCGATEIATENGDFSLLYG